MLISSEASELSLHLPITLSRSSSISTLVGTPTKDYFPSIVHELPLQHGINLPLKPILQNAKNLLSAEIANLDHPLKIVGLLATRDKGCEMYAKSTPKSLLPGIQFQLENMAKNGVPAFEVVKQRIEQIGRDKTVDGLIVYFPLFGPEKVDVPLSLGLSGRWADSPLKDAVLRQSISPRIDVEGIHVENLASSYSQPVPITRLGLDDPRLPIYPCTARAVITALQSLPVYDVSKPIGERFQGKVMTVINRSETVGRPLAAMLANDGGLVYSIDLCSTEIYQKGTEEDGGDPSPTHTVTPTKTSLEEILMRSDVVISAVPSKKYKVNTLALKQGCVCIDLSEDGNFEDNVKSAAGVFARRIGGITILMLQLNAVALRKATPFVRDSDR
ncbi:methylenetetrahydrofolate dehydrogenase (NAD+), partial [Tremellales sp. Uapishka_1]